MEEEVTSSQQIHILLSCYRDCQEADSDLHECNRDENRVLETNSQNSECHTRMQ